MKLHFTKQNNLSKLHGELLELSELKPVNGESVMHVEGNSENVWITVSDDVSQSVIEQINTIVATHDPTPLPTVSSDEVLKSKIELVTINTLIDLGVI